MMRRKFPWLDAVEYPNDIKGKCKIGEFERCSCPEIPGKLYQDNKGYYVAQKDGKIRAYVKDSGRVVKSIE